MRSTVAEISRSALINNLRVIRSKAPNSGIMAMVKANAYGHGMIDVARIIESQIDFFGVAVMYEGVALRLARISKPVVVMMPPDIYDAEKFCECDLQMVACSLEIMRDFDLEAERQRVKLKAHLYIDTGMRRDGIEPHEAVAFMQACREFQNIDIIGICTHFASSDDTDISFTLHQLEVFNNCVAELKSAGFVFEYVHAANSGALFNHPNSYFNVVRVGLSLYGINPAHIEHSDLESVLRLRTRVNALRRIEAGESVSYGRKYRTEKATTIATIPIGYGDGYSRILTQKSECLLHGKRFPVVGAICMDECMIDVGDEVVQLGDEVVLLGRQGNEEVTAWELANLMNTIPYEVTSMITSRVPRIVIEANSKA